MKLKKVLAVGLVVSMMASLTACGGSSNNDSKDNTTTDTNTTTETTPTASDTTEAGDTSDTTEPAASNGELSYADINLGDDTDLTAEISVFNNRTDMSASDYKGKNWDAYIADFNKEYPNIKVTVNTDTNYADDALVKLQGGEYEDVMLIPAVDKKDLSTYFLSFGSLDSLKDTVRFATDKEYGGQVYGIATTGDAQGVVYNKAVFEKAGITELPKTPEEFINALKAIKEKTDAIPLYTNYAAGWTMGAWDAYINGTATGDAAYMNQKLLHAKDPFADPGDGTHAYNVYKILYDAVSEGLIEDDYTTTDWEGCKGQINGGEIGCMVLGSWAYAQMRDAGDKGDDIGYMPFPITVDGKQYATAGPNYSWGINVNSDADKQKASMIFVKWMTEKSEFAYNEGGMPISLDESAKWPEVYDAFKDVEYVADEPAVAGEEDLLSTLNADSELNFNNGGDKKVQEIIEHAANQDMSFDDIMADWNSRWADAQESNEVEVQ
ncbi:MAG: ABC transporter substrate-binding protein [Lachnospiraceae bacterium]